MKKQMVKHLIGIVMLATASMAVSADMTKDEIKKNYSLDDYKKMHIYNEFPLLPNAVEHYNHLVALTLKEDRGNLMYRGILTTVVPCFDAKRNEKLLTNKQIREAQKVCDYTIEDVFRMAIEG